MMTMTTKKKTEDNESESIEFRAEEDDSWYDVKIRLRGDEESLVIVFQQFPSDKVEFKPRDFKTVEDVQTFKQRFRPLSAPLQDIECSKVVPGMTVCASHSFCNNDLYFYDAVVENVLQKKHIFENGEELCKCKFLMYWTHGPGEGKQAVKSVESICLIQSGDLKDPTFVSFLQLVMKKVSGSPNSFANSDMPELKAVDNHKTEGQDIDIGSYHHVILIDNLEKDVCPLAIMEFIHEHTKIRTLACVFPSFQSEHYARGAIMLNSGKHLEPLFCFLDNSYHIVVSSRGRPWVLPERKSRHDAFGTLMGPLMFEAQAQLQNRVFGSADIKVVHSGTEEYVTAKKRKDLFCEFIDHQKGLHDDLQLASEYAVTSRLKCDSR